MKQAISIFISILISSMANSSEIGDTRLYWGDTHLHTAYSFDAYAFGTSGTPELAYRYSKGFPVIHPVLGTRVQLENPLDFLIITDHAELLGTISGLLEGTQPELENTVSGKYLKKIAGERTKHELDNVYNQINRIGSGLENDSGLTPLDIARDLHGEHIRTAWEASIEAADAHNEPGKFTAMIGWEWTSQPGGANFHRVIFTPDNAEKASKYLPYSSLESDDPEDLWAFLIAKENELSTEFQAIPHGPNISMGLMFGDNRRNGEPIDVEYSKTKQRFETAIEVTQIKGDSETLSIFSPDDQFSDFETYNFISSPDGLTPDPTEGDYVRPGLKNGLKIGSEIGINPYKMGMAGGSDSHIGIPAIDETNFAGKSGHDALPKDRPGPSGIGAARGWDMGAAGFTAVWAKDNTRREIFEAFRRKEIYASTGPRITLRVFGGFELAEHHLNDLVDNGYALGVPMGGDLIGSEKAISRAPGFLFAGLKDPNGANLDRVQIIKLWLNANGTTQEKVFDISLSGQRSKGEALVGNTVDIKNGTYTNTIGAAELRGFWKDTEFNPSQPSLYYVRVLEIPTPRYSLLDAIALGVDPKETGRPLTIQERVYSSPIWYTPKN